MENVQNSDPRSGQVVLMCLMRQSRAALWTSCAEKLFVLDIFRLNKRFAHFEQQISTPDPLRENSRRLLSKREFYDFNFEYNSSHFSRGLPKLPLQGRGVREDE